MDDLYEDRHFTIQVYSLLPCMPLELHRIPYFVEDADWSDTQLEVNQESKRLQELGVVFYRDSEMGTPAIDVEPHEDFDAFYSHFVVDSQTFEVIRTFIEDKPCRVHWKQQGIVRRDFA